LAKPKCLSLFAAHDGDNAVAGGYWSYADGGGGLFSFQASPPASASLANPGSLAQAVSGLTTSATTPIVVTGLHPFANGQAIDISGCTDPNANGNWIITYISGIQFSLNNSSSSSTGTGANAVSTILTTQAAHGLTTGQQVVVGGVPGSAAIALNGRWTMIGVLSTTTFSLPVSALGAGVTQGTIGDGGTQIPITTPESLGRWLRAALTSYDAVAFGAISNNSSTGTRILNTAVHITIQNAISSCKGETELWGAGDWYFAADPVDGSAALHITAVTTLKGAATARYGSSNNTGSETGDAATIFHVPDTVIGVKSWHPGMSFPRGSAGAPGTLISNILFAGGGQSSLNAHGLDMRTPTRVTDCCFSGFGGNGINISSQDGGFPDNWRVDWTRVTYCQDGIHVAGGDTNNGCCYSGDFQGNRGWGVYDHSFLGCGYVECHTAENASGPYNVYAVGETTLINCYSEEDQPPSQALGNIFVIGGAMGAGFTGRSGYFGGAAASEMYTSGFLGNANVDFPISGVTAWAPHLPVTTGTTIAPQVNGVPATGYIYQAQNAGTTGPGPESPPFPDAAGATINDNGIIWKNVGIEPRISAVSAWVANTLSYTIQVVSAGYPDGYDSFFPYSSQHSEILQVRYSTDGGTTWIYFIPDRADYGYDFGLSQHQLGYSNISTTITSRSNGELLPQGVIYVASTSGFSPTGTLLVQSSAGLETVTYTGVTASPPSFTGCAGGTGTLSAGGAINQGGSGTTIYFTPYFYYTDNVWIGTTFGGIVTQFQAGSNDGTYAAFGWGHFLNYQTEADPRIDVGSPWRVAYNLATGRWIQTWANSVVAKEWAGSRSLPTPGLELFDFGLWTGSEGVGFNSISWADLSYTPGSAEWQGYNARGVQWYSVGDLLVNRNQSGTVYPLAVRPIATGGYAHTAGYGPNTNWSSGLSIRVGDTIRPSTPNGYIWRAQPGGITGPTEPDWSTALTLGATVNNNGIVWTNVGVEDGYGTNKIFDPVGVASPNMLVKDCSAGGTITLSFMEISHERYKLAGAPSSSFSVIIGTGAADSWDRSVWNTTGQSATVKATTTDAGVTIPASTAYHIFSDGTTAMRVT
jgi:hypothetical protein